MLILFIVCNLAVGTNAVKCAIENVQNVTDIVTKYMDYVDGCCYNTESVCCPSRHQQQRIIAIVVVCVDVFLLAVIVGTFIFLVRKGWVQSSRRRMHSTRSSASGATPSTDRDADLAVDLTLPSYEQAMETADSVAHNSAQTSSASEVTFMEAAQSPGLETMSTGSLHAPATNVPQSSIRSPIALSVLNRLFHRSSDVVSTATWSTESVSSTACSECGVTVTAESQKVMPCGQLSSRE